MSDESSYCKHCGQVYPASDCCGSVALTRLHSFEAGLRKDALDDSATLRALVKALRDATAALRELVDLEADNSDEFPGEPEKYERARVAITNADCELAHRALT